jgi:tetratricopeptide (TPR) repeat protein/TolB-like protein
LLKVPFITCFANAKQPCKKRLVSALRETYNPDDFPQSAKTKMVQGQNVGSYEIVSMLGSGGMGEVYRAYDRTLRRDVAIKVLPTSFERDPDRVHRLVREARLLAALNHSHIAAIYGLEQFEGARGLVLELVDGPTLADRLLGGPLLVREALMIGESLAQALMAAHDKDIVHRDVKPANIKFTRGGVLKVLDFGLGKALADTQTDCNGPQSATKVDVTRSGQILGTPAYMSPEQVGGKRVEKAADVWAFGCVLYEMLSGRMAFAGSTVSDVFAAILHDQPQWEALPNATPSKIRRLLEACLDKDPDSRLCNLSEACIAIKEAIAQLGVPPGLKIPVAAASRLRRLSFRAWVIVLSTAVIPLAIAVWWLFQAHARYTARVEIPAVAVLPLANLTNNPANDFLGIGVAETLIGNLASLPGITVVSRAAAVTSKTSGRDLVRAARDLGVTFIVDGGIQQTDHKLKVTARLVRADGSVVWGGSYEGENADLFTMESQVAQRVTAALQLRLSQTDRAKLGKPPTTDINAFTHYAQGRSLLERLDVAGNLDRAIELFGDAVGEDRNFALAYAGLGEAYWDRYQLTKNPDWTVKARDATLEALRLDPNQAVVRRLLALIYRGSGDTDTAIQELQRALELQNSDDAHQMLGEILSDKGQIEDAIAEFDKAIALRPNFAGNYDAKGLALYRAGRFAEAAASFEHVIQLQPDNASGFQRLGTTYHAAGDIEKALLNYRRSLELAPNSKTYTNLGVFYHNLGKFEDAANAYIEAIKLDPTNQITHANLGNVYGLLGRREDARSEYTIAVQMTERILQVNPKDALTLSERAVYEAKLDRRLEAQRDANAAATLAPADGQVLYDKAVVYVLAGQKGAGLKALEQALSHGASASVARQDDYLRSIRGTPEFAKLTADKH